MKCGIYFYPNILNEFINFIITFTVSPLRCIAPVKVQNKILSNLWFCIAFKCKIIKILPKIRTDHRITIPGAEYVNRFLVISEILLCTIFSLDILVNWTVKAFLIWNVKICYILTPINIDILAKITRTVYVGDINAIAFFSYNCKKFDICILIFNRAHFLQIVCCYVGKP